MKHFGNLYKGRRVLVTGHTGFKGSWLTLWLTYLGADVVGVSAYLPSDPCNFAVLGLQDHMKHVTSDVRDIDSLKAIFEENQPEIVFHLAAQAIVRKAHDNPKLTFDTNLGGTVNILECLRSTPSVKTAVIITSDKCYQNVEWPWGYRENDRLGGDDPYSASKACAEIACQAYIRSFFSASQNNAYARIATTRAGNVLGGGDWAQDRIIPDCVKALTKSEEIIIRTPEATRPWQHVFEPLSGYLWLGANLFCSEKLHGEAFNFGPDQKVNKSVEELIDLFISHWGCGSWRKERTPIKKKENILLKLSCDKALYSLGWHATLSFEDTVYFTAEWYKAYYGGMENMYEFSLKQIKQYAFEATKQKLSWVNR